MLSHSDAKSKHVIQIDIEGYKIHIGNSVPFTPTEENLIYDGKDNRFNFVEQENYPFPRLGSYRLATAAAGGISPLLP